MQSRETGQVRAQNSSWNLACLDQASNVHSQLWFMAGIWTTAISYKSKAALSMWTFLGGNTQRVHFFILSTAPPSGLYCCFDIYLAAKPWRITTRYKAWRISDKSAQGLNKAVRSLPGATKTYTILVSIAGPFSPLNTFSGIMALQERNEVNNYEHYKCGEKIWTEIWRKSGALYLASSATWLHLHLCWNAITGFGVCLYQYDRYRLSYGMAFGLVTNSGGCQILQQCLSSERLPPS